jgi:hypothetical protein
VELKNQHVPTLVLSKVLLQQLQAKGKPRQGRQHPSKKSHLNEKLDQIVPLERQLMGRAGA